MSNKILFCAGEGVGNVIQTIPAVKTLSKNGYEVHMWITHSSYPIPNIIPYVSGWYNGGEIRNLHGNFKGKIGTWWAKHALHLGPAKMMPLLNEILTPRPNLSEVEMYMIGAREAGIKRDSESWFGTCNYNNSDYECDVVIHNGYNRKSSNTSWALKSYPYYEEVVRYLTGLKVCSVGSRDEYIEGTEDKTGLQLLDTLGLIKNAKVFIGNDSGLYHCSNALGTKTLVVFTFTSVKKNFDERFHINCDVIQKQDLDCLSCQNTPRFKTCKTRACREINPKRIANIIKDKLNG